MSECRVVSLEELGVSKEVFDKIYSMGEEDGRADERKRIIDILKDELESGYLLEKLLRRITND